MWVFPTVLHMFLIMLNFASSEFFCALDHERNRSKCFRCIDVTSAKFHTISFINVSQLDTNVIHFDLYVVNYKENIFMYLHS